MSKWDFELRFDFKRDEFVLDLKERIYRKDQSNENVSTYTESKRELRSFHKNSEPDWMRVETNHEITKLASEFEPSSKYFLEFVGDRFIEKYEYNILLEEDGKEKKVITFIAKAYSQSHAERIVNALNATRTDTVVK